MVPEMPAWYASNFLRVPETKRVGGSVPVMSFCEMSICASTGGGVRVSSHVAEAEGRGRGG